MLSFLLCKLPFLALILNYKAHDASDLYLLVLNLGLYGDPNYSDVVVGKC
jgi:hypothetical protein